MYMYSICPCIDIDPRHVYMHIHVDQNELDKSQRQTYEGSWDGGGRGGGGDHLFITVARLHISCAIMTSPMS